MPRAPKLCAKCSTPTRTTYCPQHEPAPGWTRYPSANARTLTREDRRKFRDAVLAREPVCRVCGRQATEADHITPVAEGGTNNPATNGQGLCKTHHDAKTRTESRRAAYRGATTPRPGP